MSELKPSNNELGKTSENRNEVLSAENEKTSEQASQPEETPAMDIETVREELLEQPEVPLDLLTEDSPESDQPIYIDRAMKRVSLNNELKLIRTKLTSSQRLLSKSVHQPTIRRLSDVAEHTITRPVGLLGGGVLAFCGSLIYLLFSKYVGLRYNYLIFIMLFVLGYAIATAIELLSKASRPSKEN